MDVPITLKGNYLQSQVASVLGRHIRNKKQRTFNRWFRFIACLLFIFIQFDYSQKFDIQAESPYLLSLDGHMQMQNIIYFTKIVLPRGINF